VRLKQLSCIAALAVLLAAGGLSPGAYGRSVSSHSISSGWGRSTPSATPSAPSSGGFFKPGSASSAGSMPHLASSAPTSGGFTKPGAETAAGAPPRAAMATTGFDRALAAHQSAASLQKLHEQQAAFRAPPPNLETPAATSTWAQHSIEASGPRPTPTVYFAERNQYYVSVGWQPPVYVYYGAPSYGVWDALFLWSILDLHHDWAYYHQDDPAYEAWRRDADSLAQDNADLRAKLAAMDGDVAAMKARQVPPDPNYLPPGIKPDVALAAEVVTGATAPRLAFATGTPGSTYMSLCDKLKANAAPTLEIDCQSTAGSRENVMNYLAHRDEAIFASADVIDWAMRARSAGGSGLKSFGRYQLTAYSEAMFLLVNKASAIRTISDLKAGTTLYVGPAGSGTEVSYENLAHHASMRSWVVFQTHNAQYEGIRIENAPYTEAIDTVARNADTVMLVMMPGHSDFMSKVDFEFGDRVRLVSMSGDPSFAKVTDRDGNLVYHECALAGGLYPNLLGTGPVRTLCVPAIVVVSGDWVRANGRAAEDLFLTAWQFTEPDLERASAGVQ
jgi:TRAP-type uncharacterized transport system substrate-binding protein